MEKENWSTWKRKMLTEVSRRQFLETSGKAVALGGAALGLSSLNIGCDPCGSNNTSFTLHQEESMKALADAVIPGYIWPLTGEVEDAEGFGGAVEAGTWEVYKDVYYGLNCYIDELVSHMGSSFKYNSLATRQYKLSRWQNYASYWFQDISGLYRAAIMLAKFSFFSGVINSVGTDYIGFPGPSNGYYL
jgi:hypothetical protein